LDDGRCSGRRSRGRPRDGATRPHQGDPPTVERPGGRSRRDCPVSRQDAAHTHWSARIWSWSPKVGRWQPEHGRPKRPVTLEVSSDDARPGEAFDYWRNIAYYQFDADPPPGGADGFRARAKALVTPGGSLYIYQSSAVSGRRTARQIRADGGGGFTIGLVLSGRRWHQDETQVVTTAGPGQLFCYDAERVSRVKWTDHEGVHVALPRALVDAAVSGPLPPASRIIQTLNRSRLAPFLCSQLALLARQFDALSERERVVMFDVSVDLFLTILRAAFAADGDAAAMDLRTYYTTARRLIQERYADHGLTPENIAWALGCSRSTLYRAFRAHGTTVARCIREVRLQEAKRRIEEEADAPIATISAQCGFYDPAHFRRLFREHFDMNPSDVRDMVRTPARQSS